jgi:hypothetical protein
MPYTFKNMFKVAILLTIFSLNAYAEKIYYPDGDTEGLYSADAFFSGYSKDGDYLIVVDTNDYGVLPFKTIKLLEQTKKKFAEGVFFLEYRCLKPETALKAGTLIKPFQFVGERDEACDCSKWVFYEDQYYYKIKKPTGSCFGYRRYSFEDFQEIAPFIKTSTTYHPSFLD